ncbi:Uu.00g034570.m01.CDS01 [Anthostomella pinea]|uniref:Uu.00g034570.m01.CDS01 n=1 Tax=Anthostomella pinea TaxID=933095 RepID=A0AAI8V8Y3_9PEZI|nr:Uu.00g034570.m01.CDS01 [Anthostomella pinea]
MRNTAARRLLRQSIACAELGHRSVPSIDFMFSSADTLQRNISHDAARPSFIAAASYSSSSSSRAHQTQCLRRPSITTTAATITPLGLHTFHTTASTGKAREPGWKDAKSKLRSEHKKRVVEEPPEGSSNTSSPSSSAPKHPQPTPSKPLDFADVQSRLAKHDEHYTEILKKLRTGGRFNPDVIGSLRVQPDRKVATTYPLRDLAQVIPRGGRSVSLLVHEETSVKPIMSAVQASADFNQQPQRDADNELELVLKIEPEKREEVLRRTKTVCHEWRDRVRAVRQKREKSHATWRKESDLLPDLKKTADKELEKIIKARMDKVDAAEKEAVKAAEFK